MDDGLADELDSLAFVLEALFTGAISVAELRQWADARIAELQRPPTWLIDLSEFDGHAKDVYRILPVVPDREFTASERAAMAGVAVRRGRSFGDAPLTEVQVLQALGNEPAVLTEFLRQFPFLGSP